MDYTSFQKKNHTTILLHLYTEPKLPTFFIKKDPNLINWSDPTASTKAP